MTGLAPNQLEGEQTVGLARQLLLQYHKAQIHTQLTKDTSSQLSQTGEGEHWKAKKKKIVKKQDKHFPYSTPLCQIPGVGHASLSPQAVTGNVI